MATDPTTKDPSSAGSPAASENQDDALFQALLHRVAGAPDKRHLIDRCDATLRLVLAKPADAARLAELDGEIARAVAHLRDDEAHDNIHFQAAVQACLRILHTAARPHPAAAPGRAAVPLAETVVAHHGPRVHAAKPPPPSSPWRRIGLAMLLLAAAAGGAVALLSGGSPGADKDSRPLVAQMEAAARGAAAATNVFGGALSVAHSGGRVIVTAEGIPPGECISTGWDLVRKGVVTINGLTPTRVSAAKLSDLCHQDDTATIVWMPNPN